MQISSRNTLPSDSAVKVDDASIVLSSNMGKGSVTTSVLSNVVADEVRKASHCLCPYKHDTALHGRVIYKCIYALSSCCQVHTDYAYMICADHMYSISHAESMHLMRLPLSCEQAYAALRVSYPLRIQVQPSPILQDHFSAEFLWCSCPNIQTLFLSI
jgi:hypothetical protein